MKDNDLCCTAGEGKCGCGSKKDLFYWPAVVIAALIGVGLTFLCSLLGLAFGFTAFSMNSTGATVFNVSGFVGLVIVAIISMFIVGWIAGSIGRPFYVRKYSGELYGLAAWSLALVLTILLAGPSERMIANTSYRVNRSVAVVAMAENPATVGARVGAKVAGVKPNATEKENAEALATASFVTFFLFFIGALISCFGGRCAQHFCRYACCDKQSTSCKTGLPPRV